LIFAYFGIYNAYFGLFPAYFMTYFTVKICIDLLALVMFE